MKLFTWTLLRYCIIKLIIYVFVYTNNVGHSYAIEWTITQVGKDINVKKIKYKLRKVEFKKQSI